MQYSVEQLITMFRQDMNDEAEPYLWTDDEVRRYLAEAQDYFLYETRSLLDDNVGLSYKAGATSVSLPPYTIKIRHAYNQADEQPLDLVDYEEWKDYQGARPWRSDTGEVKTLITDYQSKQIRLYPIPEADGSLVLEMYRTAKNDLTVSGVLEVQDRQAQRLILLGAKAYAYSKQDAEVYDPQAEIKMLAQFEAKVRDWSHRARNARRAPRTIRYGGL